MAARCPRCKAELPVPDPGAAAPFHPFCSERCRLLDLGAWLDGDYKIPGKPVPPGGESAPPDGDEEG